MKSFFFNESQNQTFLNIFKALHLDLISKPHSLCFMGVCSTHRHIELMSHTSWRLH